MATEEPEGAELNFFGEGNDPLKTLVDINSSLSELYVSIKDSYQKFEQRHDSRDFLRDPRQTVGKLIVCHKAEAKKAEELAARLNSEVLRIANRAEDVACQESDTICTSLFWQAIENYSRRWVQTLWIIKKIFGAFESKAEQMNMLWKRTEKCTLIEEMAEGSEDGTDLFHQILARRLEKFGIDEVEDVLDEFVDSKEDEAHEAEKKRKESEGLKVLDIAREGFREVFGGLKEELEELKRESWELREELSALKRGEGN